MGNRFAITSIIYATVLIYAKRRNNSFNALFVGFFHFFQRTLNRLWDIITHCWDQHKWCTQIHLCQQPHLEEIFEYLFFIYLFVSRHEVHSKNTHTLLNAGW